MTSLLLQREHLKSFYNRYSYAVQPIIRFPFALCTFLNLNTNISYMNRLENPLAVTLVYLVSAPLPYGAIVFLTGYLLVIYVYAAFLEMALITLVLILMVVILYYGFEPEGSYLIVLTSLASLFKIPHAAPLLVGLGENLVFVIPAECDVFLYYLIVYMRRNAGVLTNNTVVDIIQKYSQILKPMTFNQTMMVMAATCAVDIIVVCPTRRLSTGCPWIIAIAADSVAELPVIFVGDFIFGVTVAVGQLILNILLSIVIAAVYNLSIFTVDYTRTKYVQSEDDDHYYYVKAMPKMNVSILDAEVQKISTRKRSTRKKDVY